MSGGEKMLLIVELKKKGKITREIYDRLLKNCFVLYRKYLYEDKLTKEEKMKKVPLFTLALGFFKPIILHLRNFTDKSEIELEVAFEKTEEWQDAILFLRQFIITAEDCGFEVRSAYFERE
ncbi:hypothetical protein J7L81_02305 [Candidatus Aerophobetes bacterium]|nr:hypothetical protein [Candidatus Aerophobetes bacterium]